jgi:hypothetical protein
MKKEHKIRLIFCRENALLLFFAFIFSIIFFWKQTITGFNFVFGKGYDVLIERFLVSHWVNVINGLENWNNPQYFYPYTDTLGYNDGYFLYGIIAWIFNIHSISGVDIIHAIIKTIGFYSMARLMLKVTKDFPISLLSAALFTLMINSSNQAGHGQLLLSSLSPLLVLPLSNLIDGILYRKHWMYIATNGILFNLLISLVFYTGFYIPWFFCLFVLILLFSVFLTTRNKSLEFIKIAISKKVLFFLLIICFFVFISPFLMVYLPKLDQTGGQSFPTQLAYSLHIADIFNIGNGSLIWGGLYSLINKYYGGVWRDGEFQVGFTPDVLLIFLISVFYFFKKNKAAGIASAFCIATIITFILPLSVNDFSVWAVINKLIPGASGLRVICRIYLILAFPICFVIGSYISSLNLKRYASYSVFLLLIASQFNMTPPVNISDNDEKTIKNISAAPVGCKYFYVKNPIDNLQSLKQNEIYSQNVQAMIIAEKVGIPTINGFATFTPHDWIFKQTPSYLYRVNKYISNHNLRSGCELDIKNNIWTAQNKINPLSDMASYTLGEKIVFSAGGNSGKFTNSGWSTPEDFGTWTDGNVATILMKLKEPSFNPLKLTIEAGAFLSNNKKDQLTVDVFINNIKIDTLNYVIKDGGNIKIQEMKIPKDSLEKTNGIIEIKLIMNPIISPYALGLGLDTRKLGLSVKSLILS